MLYVPTNRVQYNRTNEVQNNHDESRIWKIFAAIVLSGFILISPGMASPEDGNSHSSPSDLENHQESIEVTINTETANLSDLMVKQNQAETYQKSVTAELNVNKVQLSAYGNILLLPQTTSVDMEKARIDILNARDSIDKKIKELSEKIEIFTQLLNQTREQLSLNEKRLTEIDITSSKDSLTITLKKNLQTLVNLLETQHNRVEKILDIYKPLKQQLEEIRNALSDITEKLDKQIAIKKKAAMFQRSASPLVALNISQMRTELADMSHKFSRLGSTDYWQILSALLLYALFLWGVVKFQKLYRRYERNWHLEKTPWRYLALTILDKSLILMTSTAAMTGYVNLQSESAEAETMKMIANILWLCLLTQWGREGIRSAGRIQSKTISERASNNLCFKIQAIRIFGIVYVLLEWLLDGGGSILLFARMIFGLGLMAGYIHFQKSAENRFFDLPDRFQDMQPLITGTGYIIFGLGPVLELIGYGYLAVYWYVSCGLTLIVCFWGVISMKVLQEWHQVLKTDNVSRTGGHISEMYTVQWISMRILWVLWFSAIIVTVLMIWSAKHAVITGLFKIITYPIPIGEMQLSLLGFVCATLMVFATQFSTRLWRRVLRDKFLSGSGMDAGLKDSITTISVYLLWGIGIFISLRVIGVSSTSLTVVFGALSIGLGFGLQNIFNNFISGIILLFERPIQVGDAVEISGIWGVVQKINVRSTLVQTYDNASLIIPNSEFISNKVVNWSFKDHRIRRGITIGVAYGSDTQLVSRTLLEICGKIQEVLKQPAPDVLFTDFGDNALIFKLRFWTVVDHMVKVETSIRFEIERLFRERQIEMPFPQRT